MAGQISLPGWVTCSDCVYCPSCARDGQEATAAECRFTPSKFHPRSVKEMRRKAAAWAAQRKMEERVE